jgi:hypothetical protein
MPCLPLARATTEGAFDQLGLVLVAFFMGFQLIVLPRAMFARIACTIPTK